MSTPAKADQRPQTRIAPPPAGHLARSIREIVESIAIAFVLAFLFRTFEAEAFVIPTGSMAPTLMGRHKDIICPKCGNRYKASASSEDSPEVQLWKAHFAQRPDRRTQWMIQAQDTVAATCPICRYTATVAEIDAKALQDSREGSEVDAFDSSNGDRILVSKFAYAMHDPERWDVVVFKYPGDGNQNYIKRLVGLPGETLKIFQGDLFIKNRQGDRGERDLETFTIERKPPGKVLTLMQPVHDTRHDPSELFNAGWPLRWSAWPTGDGDAVDSWSVAEDASGEVVDQTYSIESDSDEVAWLRYEHIVPDMEDWLEVLGAGGERIFDEDGRPVAKPQLITDFYAYNTEAKRGLPLHGGGFAANQSLRPRGFRLGLHWTGDLLVECEATVKSDTGALLLDLVEAGRRFTCTIDIKTGEAKVSIAGYDDFSASGKTSVVGPGTYKLRFGNVDDQLLLWVNDKLVDLGGPLGSAEYDADAVFGSREAIVPKPNSIDEATGRKVAGDLAPAGVGSRGANVSLRNLRILRDIYYIADSNTAPSGSTGEITDLPRNERVYDAIGAASQDHRGVVDFLSDPDAWDIFASRRSEEFTLNKDPDNPGGDQFFVMGDNSPSSKDARLWAEAERDALTGATQKPGGSYVERRLLIGKALIVFWPHPLTHIPLIGVPIPFFPNFGDMRLIR